MKVAKEQGQLPTRECCCAETKYFPGLHGKKEVHKKYENSMGCLHLQMWIRESIYPVESRVLLLAEMLSALDIKFVAFFYEEGLRRFVVV